MARTLFPHYSHGPGQSAVGADGGFSHPPQLRNVRLDHILLDWQDPDDPSSPPFARIAHLVPGSHLAPTYYQMMRLVELTFPPQDWPIRKRQMEKALAYFYREIGYACLTRMDRGWYGTPTIVESTQCGGSLSYGHTHFREPATFLKELNPNLQTTDWDPWQDYFERS